MAQRRHISENISGRRRHMAANGGMKMNRKHRRQWRSSGEMIKAWHGGDSGARRALYCARAAHFARTPPCAASLLSAHCCALLLPPRQRCLFICFAYASRIAQRRAARTLFLRCAHRAATQAWRSGAGVS
jgi:hypothetical protein